MEKHDDQAVKAKEGHASEETTNEDVNDFQATNKDITTDYTAPSDDIFGVKTNIPGLSDEEKSDKFHSLCSDMFATMSVYLNGEVESTVQDYLLLEKMNTATKSKYEAMYQNAKMVRDNVHLLNQKFADLQPYLDQIELIEKHVLTLEQAAYKLDAYSKQLEEKFKRLERR